MTYRTMTLNNNFTNIAFAFLVILKANYMKYNSSRIHVILRFQTNSFGGFAPKISRSDVAAS